MEEKTNYICIRCNHDFKIGKTHLMRHLQRKNKCYYGKFNIDTDYLIKLLNKNEYIEFYNSLKNKKQCKYCLSLHYNTNIKRHMKTCKSNPVNQKVKEPDLTQQVINNNITNHINNINNNINIQINSIGNESYNIKEIVKELKLVFGYGNFNGNQLNFDERIENLITNYNLIFDHVYDQPENQNFKIVNKKEKICKIKDESNKYKHIKFDKLIEKIFDIITNIFDLSIIEFEINNDKKSLYHYKEFKDNLIERKNKFMIKYKNASTLQEKNNIKNSLFQYYKGFKTIIDNIKDKIILKAYDFDL